MGVFDKFSGINVASGFKLQAKAPLDPRQVVDTIEDRNALITENGAYEGMQVYVKADKKTYCLKDLIAGTWEEVGAGGGSSVQPDYNQNDISAPDYIKNRPFYDNRVSDVKELLSIKLINPTTLEDASLDTDSVITVIYNGTTYEQLPVQEVSGIKMLGNLSLIKTETNGALVPMGEDTGEPFIISNETQQMIISETEVNAGNIYCDFELPAVGETVTFSVDGIEYEQTVKEASVDGGTVSYIGNVGFVDGFLDTGEPFLITNKITINGTLGRYFFLYVKESDMSEVFPSQIYCAHETILGELKQIEPKYIKDMYYEEEPIRTTIFSGTMTTDTDSSSTFYYECSGAPTESNFPKVILEINNTPYEFVNYSATAETIIYIHKDSDSMLSIYSTKHIIRLSSSTYLGASISISIIAKKTEIKQIPEKYIPESVKADVDLVIPITVSDSGLKGLADGLNAYFKTSSDSSTLPSDYSDENFEPLFNANTLKIIVNEGATTYLFTRERRGYISVAPWYEKFYCITEEFTDIDDLVGEYIAIMQLEIVLNRSSGVEFYNFDIRSYNLCTSKNPLRVLNNVNLETDDNNGLLGFFADDPYYHASFTSQYLPLCGTVSLSDWITKAQKRTDFAIPTPSKATDLVDKQYVDSKARTTITTFTITPADIHGPVSTTTNEVNFYALTSECATNLKEWFDLIDFTKIVSATSIRVSRNGDGSAVTTPVKLSKTSEAKTILSFDNTASYLINVLNGEIEEALVILTQAANYDFTIKVLLEN